MFFFHRNELPLRHIFTPLDGKTSGPRSFTGLIAKELKGYEAKAVVFFTSIEVPAISIDNADFSPDQKYLLEM